MTRRFTLIVLTLALFAAACGDDGSSHSTSGDTSVARSGTPISTAEYSAFRAQPVACDANAPAPAQEMEFAAPDDLGLQGVVTVVIQTSCGPITIELNPGVAPAAVNSFVYLAESGYFDGTVSHRVFPGFMIQAGDPSATGRGGPGYLLPDELPPTGFIYERGVVAMANAGPNSGGSQFFLMLSDTALPPSYSVFGQVIDGLDVMDRIATVDLTARGTNPEVSSPLQTVFIDRVEISR